MSGAHKQIQMWSRSSRIEARDPQMLGGVDAVRPLSRSAGREETPAAEPARRVTPRSPLFARRSVRPTANALVSFRLCPTSSALTRSSRSANLFGIPRSFSRPVTGKRRQGLHYAAQAHPSLWADRLAGRCAPRLFSFSPNALAERASRCECAFDQPLMGPVDPSHDGVLAPRSPAGHGLNAGELCHHG